MVARHNASSNNNIHNVITNTRSPSSSRLMDNARDDTDSSTAMSASAWEASQSSSVQMEGYSGHNESESSRGESTRFLDISELGMYGRQREIEQLKALLASCGGGAHQQQPHQQQQQQQPSDGPKRRQKRQQQLVLIDGPEGSGKSTMAKHVHQLANPRNYEVVSGLGRFSKSHQDSPFGALGEACDQMCHQLSEIKQRCSHHLPLHHQNNYHNKALFFKQFTLELKQALQEEELYVLYKLVPSIELVVGLSSMNEECENTVATNMPIDERNHAKRAFRRFLELLGKYRTPVLVIDDLHFADDDSLELLESLMKNMTSGSLLIVGCCLRQQQQQQHLQSQQQKEAESFLRISRFLEAQSVLHQIHLENLPVQVVDSILVDLLYTDSERGPDTLALAETVHCKTLGNPLHVLQFISTLADEGLISYSHTKAKWTWDLDKIKYSTSAAVNVMELLQRNFRRLPLHTRNFLKLLSCLEGTITEELLNAIWNDFQENGSYFHASSTDVASNEEADGEDTLKLIVQEGFLDRTVGVRVRFRWSHDKLRDSVYALVHEKANVEIRLGNHLLEWLTVDRVEDNACCVARLLNKSSVKGLEAVRVNYLAGVECRKTSSFQLASSFLNNAIRALPRDPRWDKDEEFDHQLCLDLLTITAEIEYTLGNFERMEEYCKEVMDYKRMPFIRTRRVHSILASSHAIRENWKEAINLCIDALARLGCQIPRRFVGLRTLPALRKAEANIFHYESAILVKQSKPTESENAWTLFLLENLIEFSNKSSNKKLELAAIAKIYEVATRNELNEQSPSAFSQIGVALTNMKRFEAGGVYSRFALRLVNGVYNKRNICRTLLFSHGGSLQWTSKIELDPLMHAYRAGLAGGCIENACQAFFLYTLYCGTLTEPLQSLDKYFVSHGQHLRDFGRSPPKETMLLLDIFSKLTGRSVPTVLVSTEKLKEVTMWPAAWSRQTEIILQTMVLFHFGDFSGVFTLRKQSEEEFERQSSGSYAMCAHCFLVGLAAFSMYRATGFRKYMSIGTRVQRQLLRWTGAGNPNVLQFLYLVKAEMFDVKNDISRAQRKYEKAIGIAKERGLLRDHALASQRYGEFCVRQSSFDFARHHLEDAIDTYGEWGATAVADDLENRYSFLWESSSDLPPSEAAPVDELLCNE